MSKTQNIFDLSQEKIQALSGGEWPAFLRSAAWNFRFHFGSQVLIYAQRPDATACYTFEEWNKRFHRRLRSGTRGIALLDDREDQLQLTYVYDYRDTYSKEREELSPWSVTPAKERDICQTLQAEFLSELPTSEQQDIRELLYHSVYTLLEETALNEDLSEVIAGCRLNELSEDEAAHTFRTLVMNSAAYSVLHRCGYDPSEVVPADSLAAAAYFDSMEAMTLLGSAVQRITKKILREVSLTVAHYDKEHPHEEELNNEQGIDVSESRGASDPQPDASAGAGDREVRSSSEDVPERTQGASVSDAPHERPSDAASARDGAGDETPGAGDAPIPSGAEPGPVENAGEPAVGTPHADAEEGSGGTGLSGDDLQLSNISFDDTLFVLRRGSGFEHGKFRIQHAFSTGTFEDNSSRSEFLKKEYGMGGSSVIFPDDARGWFDSDAKGIHIRKAGCPDITLSWTVVGNRIADMVEADTYLSPEDRPAYEPFAVEYTALLARRELGNDIRSFAQEHNADPAVMQRIRDDLRAFVHEHSEDARVALSNTLTVFLNVPSVRGDADATAALALLIQGLDNHARTEDSTELPSARDAGMDVSIPTNEELDEEEKAAEQPLDREPLDIIPELPTEGEGDIDFLAEGQTVTLAGGKQYFILSLDANNVELQDIERPLFTQSMSRSILTTLLQNAKREGEPLSTSEEPLNISEEHSEAAPELSAEPSAEPSEQVASETALQGETQTRKRRNRNELNFAFMEQYAPFVLDGTLDYMRFESEGGYEPLYIERVAPNLIAMAHTYTQNGDLMLDPEIVFVVDAEHKELRPYSYEQSAMGIYQLVYDPEDTKFIAPNVALQRDLNSFLRTWISNLRAQDHAPVRGTDRDGKEYRFENGRPVEVQKELPTVQPIATDEPAPDIVFAPGDILTFDNEGYIISRVENGEVEFYSEATGEVAPVAEQSLLAAQIQYGNTVRLTPAWRRPNTTQIYAREDQRLLGDLLRHFHTWSGQDDLYIKGRYYEHICKRMENLRVTDNESQNRQTMMYAAYVIHHFFPRPDEVYNRAKDTSALLTRAEDYLDLDKNLETLGDQVRIAEWRSGGEEALYRDMAELCSHWSILDNATLARLQPLLQTHETQDFYEVIPTLYEALEKHLPVTFEYPSLQRTFDGIMRGAALYCRDRGNLYFNEHREPLHDHPEVNHSGHYWASRADKALLSDLLIHYGTFQFYYNSNLPKLSGAELLDYGEQREDILNLTVTDDIETNAANIRQVSAFLTTWVVPFLSDDAAREPARAELNLLLDHADAFDPSTIPVEEPEHSEPAEEPEEEFPFHVGDEYRDAFGGGIITNVSPPSEDGRHAGLFGVEDSESERSYIMSADIAAERLQNGEATLTPASEVEERKEEKGKEETAEPSLFDFSYPEPPAPVRAEQSEPDTEERRNYVSEDRTVSLGGPKARFRNNVEAIRLLKRLEEEHRLANSEEQAILAKYVGWGGLADAFDSRKSDWASEYAELKELLTEEEYNSARENTLTAFYTPVEVIDAVYDVLGNLGFKRGNVLDPGCGIGSFSGRLPESMSESRVYGIEKDSLSGRIAQQLYQKNNIAIEGYEKTNLPDNFFDVAVGNVPFGNFKVPDRKYDKQNLFIHDYFFAKTLDKVRPGGVIAFITSAGTMDKKSTEFRKYLSQHADLLGAIRLPNNTFKTNAGTEVTSDILFLQKREFPRVEEAYWVDLDRQYLGYDSEEGTEKWSPEHNAYFIEHPEMVLGEMKEVSGPHGPELQCIAREGEDLKEALTEAVQNITGNIREREEGLYDQEYDERESIPADPDVRNYSFTVVDDKVYFRENSEMYRATLSKTAEQRVRGLIHLRDRVRNLIDAQLDGYSDAAIEQLQKLLNDDYDAFTAKYGLINSRGNEMAFSDDSSYYLLCSLEHVNDKGEFLGKADMFYKRTIGAREHIDHVDTAEEALAVSIGERGGIDFAFMSDLTDMTREQLIAGLQGKIFRDPQNPNVYQIGAMYLSGNVRAKLAAAKAAEEEEPGEWGINIAALEKVQPKDLEPGDIGARLGSTWIPAEDVTKFMYELLDTPDWYRNTNERNYGIVEVRYSKLTNTWNISNIDWDSRNAKANTTYGTKYASAYRLLQDALNLKDTKIYDTVWEDGRDKRVLNETATMEVQEKQQQIREAFKEWLWKDPERSTRLCKEYNERFNAYVPPTFDGSLVRFHDINPEIELRPWQKDAIARVLLNGNTLLDHAVGAGKTWTMVAAAMEGKHLGLCNKSLIVVPNHLVGQWASAIYELYPNAKVLASTKKDFETRNRKKFCSRIATGDYDVVVIGHSQFERIPLSAERQKAGIQREIFDIVEAIREAKADNNESFSVKQMERTKKSLEGRLEKLNNKKRDDVITFEELGTDRLFVDESHNYKNLFLYTKMSNVAGISQTDSQRASDMFLKCRYMDELTGNKGNIHATGTALSNTMAELYAVQRYLQFDTLQEMGLGNFDQWASTFGETVNSIELAPEGTGFRARTRFARFFNIPELMSIYCQVADIKTAEMLDLPLPTPHYETVVVPASDIQKEYVQSFAERAKNIRNGTTNRNEDNMLCVVNDGRKLALDQRLMDPELPDFEHSKVNACVQRTFDTWEKTADEKLTQLIFCSLSTPKPNVFNVYDDIKKKLVAKGVPEDEIRFVHEAKNDAQKEALFQQVREGKVRILLGSTSKLGTGTNVQNLLIRGAELDVPYRPSDLEQQEGRVIRQKNSNADVYIDRYVTEGTFDAYMYQLLEIKQRFISQVHTPNPSVREAADVDEISMSYADIKALASGDPRIKERVELEMDVQRLSLLKSRHENAQFHLQQDIQNRLPAEISKTSKNLSRTRSDLIHIQSGPSRTEDNHLLPVSVKGVVYEKPAEAGAALRKAIERAKDWEVTPIGEIRGFEISVDKTEKGWFTRGGPVVKLQLSYVGKYLCDISDSDTGLVIRLNNLLDKDIPERVRTLEKKLSTAQRDLETAKSEYGKPFPRTDELREKQQRLAELTKALDLDAQDRPQEHETEVSEQENSGNSLDHIIRDAQSRQGTQAEQGRGDRSYDEHSM